MLRAPNCMPTMSVRMAYALLENGTPSVYHIKVVRRRSLPCHRLLSPQPITGLTSTAQLTMFRMDHSEHTSSTSTSTTELGTQSLSHLHQPHTNDGGFETQRLGAKKLIGGSTNSRTHLCGPATSDHETRQQVSGDESREFQDKPDSQVDLISPPMTMAAIVRWAEMVERPVHESSAEGPCAIPELTRLQISELSDRPTPTQAIFIPTPSSTCSKGRDSRTSSSYMAQRARRKCSCAADHRTMNPANVPIKSDQFRGESTSTKASCSVQSFNDLAHEEDLISMKTSNTRRYRSIEETKFLTKAVPLRFADPSS